MKSIKMYASALVFVLMINNTTIVFAQTDLPDNSSTTTGNSPGGNEYNADMGKGNHDYEASSSGWLGLLGLVGLIGLWGLRNRKKEINPPSKNS